MSDNLSKAFSLNLGYSDKGFNAGMAKSAQKAELFNKQVEKVEKGVKDTFEKKLPGAAKRSGAAIEELSKSAQKLRDRIEKAGKTQTKKELDKLSKSAQKLDLRINKLAKGTKLARGGMTSFKKSAKDAKAPVGRLDTATRSLNDRFLALGSTLVIGAGIRSFVESLLEIEKATAEVATIAGLSQGEIAKLTGEVRTMAATFGIEGKEATEALYQAISASVEPTKAVKFLTDASKLATAGLTTLKDSTDLLTSALNSYGLGAEEAGRLSDIFFQAVKDGKTTIPEIAAAFGKIGSIASNAGVSVEELGAAIATLTKTGLTTSESVTGLQQVIKAFLKPTAEAKKTAEKFGLELNATTIQAYGLEGAVKLLREALMRAKAEGFNTSEVMALLTGRVEGANAATNLAINGYESFTKSLENNKNAAGNTDEANKKVASTVGFKLRKALAMGKEELNKFGNEMLVGADSLIEYMGGAENVTKVIRGMGLVIRGTFGLMASFVKRRMLAAGQLIDTLVFKFRTASNNFQIIALKIFQLGARIRFDDKQVAALEAQIEGIRAGQKDLASSYEKSASRRSAALKKAESDQLHSIGRLESGMKNFKSFYDGIGKEIKAGSSGPGSFLSAISDSVNSVSKLLADSTVKLISQIKALKGVGGSSGPGSFGSSIFGSATRVSNLAGSAFNGITPEIAQSLIESNEADKYYEKLDADQKEANQKLIKERQRSQRALLENEIGYQRSYASVVERGARNTRSTLRNSLSSAFEEGIQDAAPAFRSALSSTLSASAQPGVSFRGSSIQAGQGTRQQLRDSLFNREATGRQIATNIQLLASGFATGGTVPGADQGRDSMLVPLRGQEEVIRPEAARPNRALLRQINRSRGPVVLPRRSENVVFPGQASGDRVFNNSSSNSSAVTNNSSITNNRSNVNVRGGINVSVPGVDAKAIANAVIKEIQYKSRRGL